MADFYISQKNWNTVINYAKASVKIHDNTEIGGMMVMLKDKEGDYVLKDPVILKQEVSGTRCVLDQNELSLFYAKAYRKYKKKGRVRYVWWHSHANMKAFWSGTDDKTILSSPSDDFTVSLVVNVRSEYKLRVQYFEPILLDDDVELNIMNSKTAQIPQSIMAEVKEKCTKPVYTGHYMDRDKKGKVKDAIYGDDQLGFDYGYGYGGGNFVRTTYHPNGKVETFSPDGKDGVVSYQVLLDYIESINSQYVTGEIEYQAWKRAIEGTNKQLAERKCKWRFNVLSSTALDEIIYYAQPHEFMIPLHLAGEKR